MSLRTHLRWPTPVRQKSDSREQGRISGFFWEETPKSRAANADQKTFSQRSGERGRHQESAPTAARSRNSLPALNAAAVVQVPQAVQRVLRKRDVVKAGRSNAAPTCGGRFLSGLRRAVVSKKGLQDVEGRKEKSGQKASSRLAEERDGASLMAGPV